MKRIVLARELSIEQMGELIRQSPKGLEFEAFVHGAMCVAYSGRCLLSAYLAGRDPNRGECAQPCRWSYALRERGPGAAYGWFPVEQDQRGTYVLNSRDLRLIQYIPQLAEAGLSSLKIEGRMKSIHYVATVTKVYRQAFDAYEADPEHFTVRQEWLDELEKISHRPIPGASLFPGRRRPTRSTASRAIPRPMNLSAWSSPTMKKKGLAWVEQRNHFKLGQTVEFLQPKGQPGPLYYRTESSTKNGQDLDAARHAQPARRPGRTAAAGTVFHDAPPGEEPC